MKQCTKCKEVKDLTNYYQKNGYKDGLDSYCKSCHRKVGYEWKRANPEKVKRSRIKNKFGLSLEEYEQMFVLQNGVCAICSNPETMIRKGKTVSLSVDHDRSCCSGDRSCGQCIRGLLCYACNTGISRFNDDVKKLEKAIQYINKSLKGEK